ncbi:MAG: amidohydrolase family protein, partial [Anaerolineae bacterium]|nr:amidohydrolase family protein [Anaerolineae bacterium]
MKTLIKNVTVLTLDDDGALLKNVALALDGERIAAIGETPADFEADEVIDGRDKVALPAFFNAHTHAAMTLERGWAEDLPFDRWLNEKIWVAESAMEAEDVYWGVSLAIAEMLRSGTIGFADHYFWMDQAARAVEDSGAKALLAWCYFGNAPGAEVGGVAFEDTLAFVETWQNAAEGRIHTTLGPHSPYMCPPEVLRRFVNEAHRLGIGAHFHLSESQEQVANSLARYGKTPVAHVADLGLLDLPAPTLVAHCNAAAEDDLVLLAESGAYVAHAPKTYQKLAMAMPPLARMLAAGVHVAFGTDGPA